VTGIRPLLGYSDEQLARVDPVRMNLLIARGIPGFEELDIGHYAQLRDKMADGVRKRLPYAEKVFARDPQNWKNDVNFLRLSVLCEHLDQDLGIHFNEDQVDLKEVWYTDGSDLFLNGVMDTKQGTCGNIPALLLAIGWRLGWPVSLACAKAHLLLRYDDGRVRYNIEGTRMGMGGFSSPEDQAYIDQHRLTPKALSSGSDLRTLTPREVMAVWIGLRGRHFHDVCNIAAAEPDYLLARYLFPANRWLHFGQVWTTVLQSTERFEDYEHGSPGTLAACIISHFEKRPLIRVPPSNAPPIDLRNDPNIPRGVHTIGPEILNHGADYIDVALGR
jgi:hypothetical protein